MLPEDDRGFLLGDGLFETVLAEAGALADWDAHVRRLARGCGELGLPAPEAEALRAAADAALAAAGLGQERAAVRLTWTAGGGGRGLDRPERVSPRLYASAAAAPLSEGRATVVVTSVVRCSASVGSRLKTLNYLDNVLARREARSRGFDEGLMLNERGEVACAAAANVFWLSAGRLFTPAAACGALDGIMRARATGAARALGVEVVEARVGPEALDGAEGVFLTNSLIGVRPVEALTGRALDVPPLVQAIRDRA